MAKCFFPPESSTDNMVFTKLDIGWFSIAVTYHNAFRDIFAPESHPESHGGTFRLFPAMLLFRHTMELLLKAILNDSCHARPPTSEHNLDKLDVQVMQCLPNPWGDDMVFVREALSELQAVDPGTGFRYGTNKQNELHFKGQPKTVDATRLFGVCKKLWEVLMNAHGPVSFPEKRIV